MKYVEYYHVFDKLVQLFWFCFFVCCIKLVLIINSGYPEYWEKRNKWFEQKLFRKSVDVDLNEISSIPLFIIPNKKLKQEYPLLYKYSRLGCFFGVLCIISATIGIILGILDFFRS